MDNIHQLFIRACKSKDPVKRLRSTRKRFFLEDKGRSKDFYDYHIAIILAEICEKYDLATISDLICSLNSDLWLEKESNYNEKTLSFLIKKIRFCKVDKIQGFKTPLKFKEKK